MGLDTKYELVINKAVNPRVRTINKSNWIVNAVLGFFYKIWKNSRSGIRIADKVFLNASLKPIWLQRKKGKGLILQWLSKPNLLSFFLSLSCTRGGIVDELLYAVRTDWMRSTYDVRAEMLYSIEYMFFDFKRTSSISSSQIVYTHMPTWVIHMRRPSTTSWIWREEEKASDYAKEFFLLLLLKVVMKRTRLL